MQEDQRVAHEDEHRGRSECAPDNEGGDEQRKKHGEARNQLPCTAPARSSWSRVARARHARRVAERDREEERTGAAVRARLDPEPARAWPHVERQPVLAPWLEVDD